MINKKRVLGIPAATGDAVIGEAVVRNQGIHWNQPKVRTMTRKYLWKPLCGLLVPLFIALPGRSDVVQDWNAIMQATVSSQPPFPGARSAAIAQLAVFEAVNAITREYRPYLGTITAPHDASPEAAAAAAAYGVLSNYFPTSLSTLNHAYATSLAAIPDGPRKTAGIATGQAAAAAMMAARANDGSTPLEFFVPTSLNPGVWEPTPSCSAAGGLFFNWQNVTPFGIRSGSQFVLRPPPALTSGRYTRAYDEVKLLGDANSTERTQDQTNIALFYNNEIPVLIFNEAARQITTARPRSLSENARDFALINMAISDAGVANFYNKYLYGFWRPETAIHEAGDDGNDRTTPDPNFTPLIKTPCFPSYPSAHGALSNAAREMMEKIYGEGPFSITLSTPALPGVTLHYSRLEEITDDISDARVYGGIHFRTDQDAGALLGARVADYIYNHKLRPEHDGDSDDR
jgi:membrane-associated phospholipid phosphatase